MHTEKEEKKDSIGNTKTRELILDASTSDLSTEELPDTDETETKDGRSGDSESANE